MPDFVSISDPVAGESATGRVRFDLRRPPIEPPIEPSLDRKPDLRTKGNSSPPLVLLGGMTQTLASWGGQIRPLSKSRPVLAYEARGQGSTVLSIERADLAQHVDDLVSLVHALELPTPFDLCGFSFGARVCLSVAASRPQLVRRLVLSGLGIDRGVVGRLIVQGWIAALGTGNLEALARISLPDIVGPAYLEQHADLVEPMVTAVMQRNSFEGIRALFLQTLEAPEGSPWTTAALAERVRCPTLVMGGALDRLAPPTEVAELARRLGGRHVTFPNAGHTIPIEAATAWREAVLAFLDEDEPSAS